ncbi:MAG: aminotransferase class V-fold PLP-dependent enzyme [Actinobacteria bacterium]|nr:aminotransferase class V-fold PLP-dependent enzyme [Actinomycetota bacterium]
MAPFDFLKTLEEQLKTLEEQLKPYRDRFATFARLPETGRSREEILAEIAQLQAVEEQRWKAGYASGAVYHGDGEHIDFLNRIYALHSQSNPLHPDLWPSAVKFEAEIVSMTANMLGAEAAAGADPNRRVCGTVSSGGTESLLLAMKTYRDWARERKGITDPEAIVPVTAHAAFEKAAQYFGIRLIRVPLDSDYRADVAAVRAAITENTIVIVGSAPAFPHGIIDPIPELAALAREQDVGCHVDACLGGFVLPWAERLGYPVPVFDFRLPGVTSISADTHKYGYAAKGTSVILYRSPELLHHQYFATADWPGGLYFSPTFAGSRPGALSAACWASLVSMGQEGYLEATRRILETARTIKEGIREIPELQVLGDPLWVIAFASDQLNIYQVMDHMMTRGWSLNGLHQPAALHIALTLRQTQPGVAERFLSDLRAAVAEAKERAAAAEAKELAAVGEAKEHPGELTGMAPIYGMAAQLPSPMVNEILKSYIDLMFKA